MRLAPDPLRRDRESDACPGVLTLHQAADGGLARIRVPGGLLSLEQWQALIRASADYGDANLHLTSRGNVEIRGVERSGDLSQALQVAGLLPSASHERVRNVLASPLSGLDSSWVADVTPLVDQLDASILASPSLAGLSAKFCFGLDDGRGDIVGLRPDLALRATSSSSAMLAVDRLDAGLTVQWDEAAELLVGAAELFLAIEPSAWRIRDVPGLAEQLVARLGGTSEALPDMTSASPSYGPVGDGQALVVGIPLGQLSPAQALALQAPSLRITPWRSVVLTGLSPAESLLSCTELERLGLETNTDSRWRNVSACTGRPGCAKAAADVRFDARVTHADLISTTPVHWSGCERRCGRPAGSVIDVLATPAGYEVHSADGFDTAPLAERLARL